MYLIAGIILIIILLFFYQYIFNIYEVTYKVEPEHLYSDNKSEIIIQTIPLNAFGWKAPLRNAYADFEIREGKDLVEIVSEDNEKGMLVLKAKSSPGKAVVFVKPKLSLLPSSIEIEILPNYAGNANN